MRTRMTIMAMGKPTTTRAITIGAPPERIDSTPTSRCPSTTGRCRTPSSAMRWAATARSSSGATVTGRSVM